MKMRAVLLLMLAALVVATEARVYRMIEIADGEEKFSKLKGRLGTTLDSETAEVPRHRVSYIQLNKSLGCEDSECQNLCWLSGFKYGKCADANSCICTNV